MKWGWIDLLTSIPLMDIFRSDRIFRIIKIIRVLRAFRSTKFILAHVFKDRRKDTASSAAIIAILMVIFSSVAILQFETANNSNIKTAEDALWWSYVTNTTVGYGDKYPVTTEGRLIGAALMTVGVGIFGTLTGLMAAWFTNQKRS